MDFGTAAQVASLSQKSSLNRRKVIRQKKGVVFNVMVVGTAGLGKSTLVRSLIGADLIKKRDYTIPYGKTVDIYSVPFELDTGDQKVTLNLIDTPGFGDQIDNTPHFDRLVNYIDEQFKRFLDEESRINRNTKFQDTRVHAVLYFIAPTGHGLKEIDVLCMRNLGQRVNVIPVVARADSFTPIELSTFKSQVLRDIATFEIPIFDFPARSDDDEEFLQESDNLRALLPFSVIGAEGVFDVNGKQVHGRKYLWGIVDVENDHLCDFNRLKESLFITHLDILKEVCIEIHYENYRENQLKQTGVLDSSKIEKELREREQLERTASMNLGHSPSTSVKHDDDDEKKKKKKADKAEKGEKSEKSEKKEKKKKDSVDHAAPPSTSEDADE